MPHSEASRRPRFWADGRESGGETAPFPPWCSYLVVVQHHLDVEQWVGPRLGVPVDGLGHDHQGALDVESKGLRQDNVTGLCVAEPFVLHLQLRQSFACYSLR